MSESYSIVDILSYKNWRQVLFTTYALSLTFFESFVMRKLREQKCRDVTLIVDADGYLMSLSERRSSHVGQDYRIIPVALKNGVFHAKCMYLSADDGDVIVIGSGNMTFGGFGKNIEVFEILTPIESPNTFAEFAEFLDLLAIKDDFICPDDSWIEHFATLSRRASEAVTETPSIQPRLLHTVESSIVDQLRDIVTDVTEIKILSPYYDNDGKAVKKLADITSPQKLSIGIPPLIKQKINFPFKNTSDWPYAFSAIKPKIKEKPERYLHAKWLHIYTTLEELFEITGSINATDKALCSTENIEVGLLRQTHKGNEQLQWKQAKLPPSDTSFQYNKSGLGQKCLVYATLKQDSQLIGSVLSKGELEGMWDGAFETKSGDFHEFSIVVDENGLFRDHLQLPEDIIFGSGLQINLSKDSIAGRGWVNQENFLQLSKEQRSFTRLINREDTVEDEIALMDYLAISAARHQLIFRKPIKNHKSKPKGNEQDLPKEITIDLEELTPSESAEFDVNISQDVNKAHNDILTQIRRVLLGHKKRAEKDESTEVDENPDDLTKDKKSLESRENKSRKASFYNFYHCMIRLSKDAPSSKLRKAALVILFEVAMYMFRRQKQEVEAMEFLREWFSRVGHEHYIEEEAGALEQHFVTCAAVIASQHHTASAPEEHLTRVHENLESYWQGKVDRDYASQVLIEDINIGFLDYLLEDNSINLFENLQLALSHRTIRDHLSEQYDIIGKEESVDKTVFDILGPVGKEYSSISNARRRKQLLLLFPDKWQEGVCPGCSLELTAQQKVFLKQNRLAKCTSCSRFIINLRP